MASRNLSGGKEAPLLQAPVKERMEKLFGVANGWYTIAGGRCSWLADGQPDWPLLIVDRITSNPPWATYSTSWASPAVGSSSSSPSTRAVINLSVPAE